MYSVNFTDINTGWVVGDNGNIFNTTNGGLNWQSQFSCSDNLLRSVHFYDRDIGWAVETLEQYLKTTNGGVSFVEEKEIDEMPTKYYLSNNYPNPFNPSTKIKYSVPHSSKVVIKVFDVLGNEIETLVNEEKPAGTYELTWYAESAAGRARGPRLAWRTLGTVGATDLATAGEGREETETQRAGTRRSRVSARAGFRVRAVVAGTGCRAGRFCLCLPAARGQCS